ncbi:MAG: acetate--CoA ligase family protein, partial [Burkholderiaceae bacterium]
MLRHRLAALFEPRSLLVVTDRSLPVVQMPPKWLRPALTYVHLPPNQPVTLPRELQGVPPGVRVDQALVGVSADRLPDVLQALEPFRPRAVNILVSEHNALSPDDDIALCRSWALQHDAVLLGPRAFGVQRPHLGLNLSHQVTPPLGGRVALIAQSRSITASVLDWAEDISLGFSAVVSAGDEAGVDVADLLDYLALDARTDSIVLYLEETAASRKFTSALRAAAGVKPVVVLKVTHGTQSTPENEAVFNALLRRVGAVRVQFFIQLFSAMKVLGYSRRPSGRKVALFSNGSGPSRLAMDVIGDGRSVFRAELSAATRKTIQQVLEPGAVVDNPVVTYAGLQPGALRSVINALIADSGVDGLLVVLAPDPLADLPGAAQVLAGLASDSRKPILSCFMGDASMRELRHVLDRVGAPAFRTPESAASAFGILGAYHYNQTLAQQTLPPEPLDRAPLLAQARELLARVQAHRRLQLDHDECMQLLRCFHVPVQDAATLPLSPSSDEAVPMAVRVRRDDRFGPYITFGYGADYVTQAVDALAMELPPLNSYLARKLVQRSAIWSGVLAQEMNPVVFEHLIEALERISELISELPNVQALAIDPLHFDDTGLHAGRIRIELTPQAVLVLPETVGYRHMAIHPYPRYLVQAKQFRDGRAWMLRPIRPEDAEPLQNFVRDLSDESRDMRFVSMLRELTPRMLARYTRIDYDRELALIATVQEPNPENRGYPREGII